MQGAEFDALKADIAEHGLREPIWLHPDGSIIDGRNRHRACVELGITPDFEAWNGNGSLVAFVVSLNLHRRHLTESQRAMVAAKLANMPHGGAFRSANLQIEKTSQAQAADLLQVSPRSIANARVVYTGGSHDLVDAVERGEVAVSAAAQVATLPTEWQRVIVENGGVAEAAKDIRQGRPEAIEERVKPHVSHNSGNNEWYTPIEYIEAARRVLGWIDLDPASNPLANEVVKADIFYTVDDDGLSQEWEGRVWMNPPYARIIERFAEKLVHHYEKGDVTSAIVLVNNATETAWFRRMAATSAAICFPSSRVKFWQPHSDEPGAPLQGQAILYMGGDVDAFASEFSSFGLMVEVL